jgi:hypothetical protein
MVRNTSQTTVAVIPVLNAFNTPYFRSPNISVGGTSPRPGGGVAAVGSFGKVLSQGNFPRFVQIGGRLYF